MSSILKFFLSLVIFVLPSFIFGTAVRSMAEAEAPTVAEELITASFRSVVDQSDLRVTSERMIVTRALAEKLLEAVKSEKGREALETFSRGVSQKLVSCSSLMQGSHPFKEPFLSCLSSMGSKGQHPDDTVETYQAFTKKWITAVNRGGLFFVSDEVYTFFLEL